MKKQKTLLISAQSFLKSQPLMAELTARCALASLNVKTLDTGDGAGLSEDKLRSSLPEIDYWLVGREPVNRNVLSNAKNLSKIVKYGVGLDNIDFDACKASQVEVLHSPGVNARHVAELTLGLMISSCRNIAKSSRLIAKGEWRKNGGYSLFGRTVGIVGCGHVGSALIELVKPFSCSILICDIRPMSASILETDKIQQVSLDDLLKCSDVVSLHVPLTNLTRGMLSDSQFQLMKSSSYLINTSRGAVIDQSSLRRALENHVIAGAACDVFEQEPLNDPELTSLLSFTGTPHIAGNSEEAVWAMGMAAVDALFSDEIIFTAR